MAAIQRSTIPVVIAPGKRDSPAGPAMRKASAMNWTVVFHFASAVTGSGTLSSARYSRKPETRISRQRMTIAAHSVRPEMVSVGGEHQDDRGDEKLVGDRVQHPSKRRLLRPRARQIAVKKVANPGGDEDRERGPPRPRLIRPEQKPGDQRHRRDPRVSQNIGQSPVAADGTSGRRNHLRRSRHRACSPVNSTRKAQAPSGRQPRDADKAGDDAAPAGLRPPNFV